MLKLTHLVDGTDYNFDPTRRFDRVVYVDCRHIYAIEQAETTPNGCSLISAEGKTIALVKENPDDVARMVAQEAPPKLLLCPSCGWRHATEKS